ncbi:MAG: hypothetical protein H6551_04590 [Chitinophagales bacterium]|nr:hypothetical protein [Chitinophagaceae bacterium]MCB9064403.1 hypothetical protein [Chitinophagales bacterium]
MYKHFTLIPIIGILLLSTTVNAQNSRKVLFLGNSYTQYNNLPNLVSQIATSMGDTLVQSSVTPGGQTFQGHSTDVTAQNAIKQQKWDIVVLQEQSQKPAFSPSQVASDVYPYAQSLCNSIRANDTCTQPMFYMTWGRKNGDASNCASYPPICTYGGMQQRLRESYLQMAQDNKALTSPVGAAWNMVRDSLSSLNLYDADESHPSLAGSYLAACVFYASIFHKNPHGSTFTAGLSASDAERLQYFAGKVVMDSLNQWQQHGNYVSASFTYTIAGDGSIVTNNTSVNGKSYLWQGPNAYTSSMKDPVIPIAAPGKYPIKLTVSNDCFSETRIDTVVVPVGINDVSGHVNNIKIGYNSGQVTITDSRNEYNTLRIINTSGVTVKTYDLRENNTVIVSDVIPGIYIYMAESNTKRDVGKIVVHL